MKHIVVTTNGGNVETIESFTFNGYTVPKGFKSDGATINTVLYVLFAVGLLYPLAMVLFIIAVYIARSSYHPRNLTSAVWHDYMCGLELYDEADKGFLELLRLEGENEIRAKGKWLFVRLWHRVAYKNNKDRKWLALYKKIKGKK